MRFLRRLNPGLFAGVFSFVVAVAFVPWFSGAAEAPRWALLAGAGAAGWCIAAAPRRVERVLGAAFLIFAGVSLAWTPGIHDGIGALAKLVILAGIFRIGTALPSLQPVYIGLAVGFAVNSAIVVAQWYGWSQIPQLAPPAGLFVIKNYVAEPAAMLAVALVASRLWWLVPGIVPALVLPGARGAMVGLAVAALAGIWMKSRILATALAGVGLIGLAMAGPGGGSLEERLLIYKATVGGMAWAGHGLGSFFTNFPSHAPDVPFWINRPAHVHNDMLEMVYELGPGALLYLAMIALALCGPNGAEKLVLIVFLTEGCFAFPLHLPVTAALAALAAGRLCRERLPLCGGDAVRRAAVFRGLALSRAPG